MAKWDKPQDKAELPMIACWKCGKEKPLIGLRQEMLCEDKHGGFGPVWMTPAGLRQHGVFLNYKQKYTDYLRGWDS